MEKHPITADVRHSYYDMGDKLGALYEAVKDDPVMKEDLILLGIVRFLCEGSRALKQHLNANYIWD